MALFILVEFLCDKTIGIVKKEDVINMPHAGLVVGNEIVVRWNDSKKCYDAVVLAVNDNYDKLKEIQQQLLKKPQKKMQSSAKSKNMPSSSKTVFDKSSDEESKESPKLKAKKLGKSGTAKETESKKRVKTSSDEENVESPKLKAKKMKLKTSTVAQAKEIECMKFDLIDDNSENESIMEFKSNGFELQSKDKEIADLQMKVKELTKQIEKLKNEHKTHVLEIEELLTLSGSLKTSLLTLENVLQRVPKASTSNSGSSSSSDRSVSSISGRSGSSTSADKIKNNWTLVSLPEASKNDIAPIAQINDVDDEAAMQLMWQSTDNNVMKLVAEYEAYIHVDCFKSVMSSSNSGTQLARNLTKAMFKPKALQTCSVFGGKSKGPLGKTDDARTALHSDTVRAIISFSLGKSRLHKWEDNRSNIVKAIGSFLSRSRPKTE